jgi:cystathionine beta-lyase
LAKALEDAIIQMGWSVSPDDAYQALRGLRTLPVRMARHGESGLDLAAWLKDQPQVLQILHPGLPGSEDHALWRRDFTGACGLFGIVMQPAPERAVNAFLDALSLFGLGFSWGGFESLAISCDPQLASRRRTPALPGPLIRLHVGLEDVEDLRQDLARALAAFDAAR